MIKKYIETLDLIFFLFYPSKDILMTLKMCQWLRKVLAKCLFNKGFLFRVKQRYMII